MRTLSLRSAPSGPAFQGEADGDTLIWSESGRGFVVGAGVLSIAIFGVSTSNTPAQNTALINEALAEALVRGAQLYWPAVYQVDGNLPDLHEVNHLGPGGVRRGSSTFYVCPVPGQTNRLYCAANGSATNDGLTTAFPLTLTQAAATLRNYGPELNGTWRIVLAAGTYPDRNVTFDTHSRGWVIVQGPTVGHPNVPTAILDGTGAGNNTHGFIIGTGDSPAGVSVWFQDIKCINFNAGTQNSCGWSQGYAARCIFVNCHADNCDFAGILADQGDICLVRGGIISNCRDGVVLNATKGTVGYSSPFTPGSNTRIIGCSEFGVYWSRGAQGHVDNCLFDQNAKHLVIESSARAHVLGNDFRRASVYAVGTNTDGSWYDDVSTPNIFNGGTANANAKDYDTAAYTGSQQGWAGASVSEMCLYAANPGTTLTSTTKAQIGPNLLMPNGVYPGQNGQLRPNYFVSPRTKIRIKVWGDTPNAAASFGVNFFDGTNAVAMAYSAFVGTPSAAGFEYTLDICPLTATTQRGYANLAGSGGGARIESGASAADMRLPQFIQLMAQSALGQMLVRRVEVWVMG